MLRSVARQYAQRITPKLAISGTIASVSAIALASTAQSYYGADKLQYNKFTSSFIAFASRYKSPHESIPNPRTLSDLLQWQDYGPGYTEPVPDTSALPQHGVRHLVGSNLEEAIIDKDKDVFIQFAKDGCHACQSFARTCDALSFAFRDVPTVQFAEVRGMRNYVPGILTSSEEMLFPTLKFFPGGDITANQMNEAKIFVQNVRDQAKHLRETYDLDTDADSISLKYDKLDFPGVGFTFPMVNQEKDDYIWIALIDYIYEHAAHKFDKDAVKEQVKLLEPVLKEEIHHIFRQALPPAELVPSLSPCGASWDAFQDAMTRRGVGASKVYEINDAMSAVQQCVSRQPEQEIEFWDTVMKNSVNMVKTLNVVKNAKSNGELTPDGAQEFFNQLSSAQVNKTNV